MKLIPVIRQITTELISVLKLIYIKIQLNESIKKSMCDIAQISMVNDICL